MAYIELFVVCAAALMASGLTLFSGFGLGTLLMPVVALFFPVDVAIAMTAMVHLANNIFKVGLVGRHANPSLLLRFGVPAIFAAFAGAMILGWLSGAPPLLSYDAWGRTCHISALKLLVGMLIVGFVLLELSPAFSALSLDPKFVPLGGLVSGFFGGLSGHQGAFRSMFLLKAGLTKEQFVATGVLLAVMVDISRMMIYGWDLSRSGGPDVNWTLVISASLAAFTGAVIGKRLLKKMTIRSIQFLVSVLLLVVAAGLITGIL
jgi:uncharacterized protein